MSLARPLRDATAAFLVDLSGAERGLMVAALSDAFSARCDWAVRAKSKRFAARFCALSGVLWPSGQRSAGFDRALGQMRLALRGAAG